MMPTLDQPRVDTSLEEVLRSVRPRLKVLFARYSIPPQDTEDLLQQALLAFVYQRQVVRDPESWLLGTVRNKCLRYWRDCRRKLYDVVDSSVLELLARPTVPAQDGGDVERDLACALDQLPARCRSLLSLRYRGFEPPELASRLGYRPASISKVTHRCLAALTRRLIIGSPVRRRAGHG
jgi:RNA polymerase sigma factor (sigma-70 family)